MIKWNEYNILLWNLLKKKSLSEFETKGVCINTHLTDASSEDVTLNEPTHYG